MYSFLWKQLNRFVFVPHHTCLLCRSSFVILSDNIHLRVSRMIRATAPILTLIAAFLSGALSWEPGDSKPNVVFILADDLGEISQILFMLHQKTFCPQLRIRRCALGGQRRNHHRRPPQGPRRGGHHLRPVLRLTPVLPQQSCCTHRILPHSQWL